MRKKDDVKKFVNSEGRRGRNDKKIQKRRRCLNEFEAIYDIVEEEEEANYKIKIINWKEEEDTKKVRKVFNKISKKELRQHNWESVSIFREGKGEGGKIAKKKRKAEEDKEEEEQWKRGNTGRTKTTTTINQ